MVVGIDEVGRGSWAGPVVAAAVMLSAPVRGLRDSKLLSLRQRQQLSRIIRKHALAIGIGWVPAWVVDRYGLDQAVRLAMSEALQQVPPLYERIIIDGNRNFLHEAGAETLVRADQLVPEVSAASIIAKVARDEYMASMAQRYPDYCFEQHVGYGTALHRERLAVHGVCRLHRLSYRPVKLFAIQA